MNLWNTKMVLSCKTIFKVYIYWDGIAYVSGKTSGVLLHLPLNLHSLLLLPVVALLCICLCMCVCVCPWGLLVSLYWKNSCLLLLLIHTQIWLSLSECVESRMSCLCWGGGSSFQGHESGKCMTTRMDGRGALTLMIPCSSGDLCTAMVSTYAHDILSFGALRLRSGPVLDQCHMIL